MIEFVSINCIMKNCLSQVQNADGKLDMIAWQIDAFEKEFEDSETEVSTYSIEPCMEMNLFMYQLSIGSEKNLNFAACISAATPALCNASERRVSSIAPRHSGSSAIAEAADRFSQSSAVTGSWAF